jgi:hypothetical protein
MAGFPSGRRPAMGLIQTGIARAGNLDEAPREVGQESASTTMARPLARLTRPRRLCFQCVPVVGRKVEALIVSMRCDPVPKEFG